MYLTIGNIDKDTRRATSSHAWILIGYIPVSKFEHVDAKKRSALMHQFFHDCMRIILASLKEAAAGEKMGCADGYIRLMCLILAIYIADYPEQCLVCCCRENSCPRCLVTPKARGDLSDSDWRDVQETLRILREKAHGANPAEFMEQNLRAINPFWADFPHCNIFSAMTPDALHEVHNGAFGDHFVKWSTEALDGKKPELDARFRAMTPHPSLRHFKKGISLTTQWTGTERKEMEKVFLGVLAGATDSRVQRAMQGALDFIHYAHFEVHTDEGLQLMDAAWAAFHAEKDVFVDLKIREHFNINKLHKLKHYTNGICSRGMTGGYSTESTERLHIDLAKVRYKATNKKAYMRQMTQWLSRQEAVRKFDAYLCWVRGRGSGGNGDEDEEEDWEDEEDEGDATSPPTAQTAASSMPVAGEAETQDFHAADHSYAVAKTPAFRRLSPTKIAANFHAPDSSFTSSASLIQNQFGPESSELIPMPLSLTCIVKSPSPSLPSRLLGTSR